MNLTPTAAPVIGAQFEYSIYPSKTYAMDMESMRIKGSVDGLEAVRQAVWKALRTERFQYRAYSANYGTELEDKLGTPVGYALPEIKRCIAESLEWDTRIDSVDGFEFTAQGNSVLARFTVHSIYGDFETEAEVTV